jgi:hypothetical protein
VPVWEGLLGIFDNATMIGADHWLTVIGLPVSAFWILLVEIGLPWILFVVWIFRDGLRSRRPWKIFLVAYPLLYVLLTFLFMHTGPGHDFVSRGMIPAQISIILGACLLLDEIRLASWNRWARAAMVYALGAAILAQTLTPLFDLRERTMLALSWTLQSAQPVQVLHVTVASAMGSIPAPYQYIYWINTHTAPDAVVVEYGPLTDDTYFRLMQRLRLIPPEAAAGLSLLPTDVEQANPAAWSQLQSASAGKDPLTLAAESPFLRDRQPPVYLVLRTPDQKAPGRVVYTDDYVRIIRANLLFP